MTARERVVLGPLPPSFLCLETRTIDGETTTTVTVDPATPRPTGQAELPNDARPPPVPTTPRPHIPAQPRYPTQPGFSITVAQALLNKSYTLIGSMDPYLRLKVGHNIYETFTASGSDKNPMWNKIYHCPIPNQSSIRSFTIEIFDEKALQRDDRIAYAKINIPQSVFEGHTLDEWFPLSGKQGEGKEGTINLIISYTTMPMVSHPYQRVPYPYTAHIPQHYPMVQQPPLQISEEDINRLKDMFPDVDKQVIKTVLESKYGNMEEAVSAILQMSMVEQPAPQQQTSPQQ